MVRRLVVALMIVAVMAAMGLVGPTTAIVPTSAYPHASASAQEPGQTVSCAPWQIAWYVSESLWWYGWSWRWCYNPSIQGSWYVDWASWAWGGYAGPGYTPGYQYSVSAGPGPG